MDEGRLVKCAVNLMFAERKTGDTDGLTDDGDLDGTMQADGG